MTQQVENTTWFKQLRHEANWTQEQLAVRLGIAVSTLRSWERGKVEPSMTLKQWEEFAIAVNVPLNELCVRISKTA
ncbi:transcriptional regulator, XRE family (plasmid) [Leptolyngbya sp. NIES-3755]|nr:transcriptional regulator, XRE family [Leptolyngbya sp. NIES-3755]